MRRTLYTTMLSALIVSTAAWANSDQVSGQTSKGYSSDVNTQTMDTSSQAPGTTDETNMTTRAEAREVTQGYLGNELLGIKPQVGVISYTDELGDIQGRAAAGFTAELNLAATVAKSVPNFYIGPVTGLIYTHTGDPSSNFFGSNSPVAVGSAGSNMFFIPANLKVGYNVTDKFRISVHGGGNVIYRSVASAVSMDPGNFGNTGSNWTIFPNAGGDLEYAVGDHIALLARPDWTFTTGSDMFTGTVGVSFNVG